MTPPTAEAVVRGYFDFLGKTALPRDETQLAELKDRLAAECVERVRALSAVPDDGLGSNRKGDLPTEYAAELCSRLDAVVTEEDQFHPVGCSTWWEEARVAVDMAKDFIRQAAQPDASQVGTARSDVNQVHPAPEPVEGIRAKLQAAVDRVAYVPGDHPIVPNKHAAFVDEVKAILALQSGERS